MLAIWRTGATVLAAWVADRLLGRVFPRRDGSARPPIPPPPSFSPEQVALFAREEAGERHFLPATARGIRETLRLRSAVPVAIPGLGDRAAAWAVCPLRSGAEIAADVADRVATRGGPVLVSLSAVLLRTGDPCPALVVAASPADAARLAGSRGHFAHLDAAPAASPAPEATVPAEETPPPRVAATEDQEESERGARVKTPEATPAPAAPARANGAPAPKKRGLRHEAGERDRSGE